MIAGLFGTPIPNPVDVVTAPFRWGMDQLKSAGGDLIKEAFQWLVGHVLSGVAWLFMTIWRFVSDATTPQLYAQWFSGPDGIFTAVKTFAVALFMLMVILAIAHAVWNKGEGFIRAVVQDFPKTVFKLTTALFITTLGLGLADALSEWFMGMFAGSTTDFAKSMAGVAGELNFGAGLFVVLLTGVLMIPLLLFIAVMLVFRSGFIYLLVCLVVIADVVDIWQPLKGSSARAWRLLLGVVAAKPLIALCFAIGGMALAAMDEKDNVEAVSEPGTEVTQEAGAEQADEILGEDASDLGPTLGTLLAGMATMALAAVAPFAALRLFPIAEAAAGAEAQSELTAKGKRAATTAATAMAGGGGGGGAAAAGGGGASQSAAGRMAG